MYCILKIFNLILFIQIKNLTFLTKSSIKMKKLLLCLALASIVGCREESPATEQLSSTSIAGTDKVGIKTTEDLTDVSFLNSKEGVISGTNGYFAKTNDGGKSWTKMNAGSEDSFMSTFMLDSNTFWVARNGLYGTKDGGKTFAEYGNFGEVYNSIFAIHFFNKENGLIIKSGKVFQTTDGGTSWNIVEDESTYLQSMQVVNKTVYVAGGIQSQYQHFGEMYKSTDGGNTWTNATEQFFDSKITHISFVSENTGFYTNALDQLFKTTDGGATWTKISDLGDSVTAMIFVDEQKGWYAQFDGKIFATEDGGKTWKKDFAQAKLPVSAFRLKDKNLYLVGNEGLFLSKQVLK